ncbi:hypothetical protein ACWH2Z_22940 [Enterobacter mori]
MQNMVSIDISYRGNVLFFSFNKVNRIAPVMVFYKLPEFVTAICISKSLATEDGAAAPSISLPFLSAEPHPLVLRSEVVLMQYALKTAL